MATFKKHGNRSYRAKINDEVFAQIRPYRKTKLCPPNPEYVYDSSGYDWGLEYRSVDTGRIIRHGGIWPTIKAAEEEANSVNPLDFSA